MTISRSVAVFLECILEIDGNLGRVEIQSFFEERLFRNNFRLLRTRTKPSSPLKGRQIHRRWHKSCDKPCKPSRRTCPSSRLEYLEYLEYS